MINFATDKDRLPAKPGKQTALRKIPHQEGRTKVAPAMKPLPDKELQLPKTLLADAILGPTKLTMKTRQSTVSLI